MVEEPWQAVVHGVAQVDMTDLACTCRVPSYHAPTVTVSKDHAADPCR